ncbi:MAG: DUF983 domain-containing protein [Novosphingobium meiothermophilum]|uniref:DUF983 domain-containing protein n=1 Tax=Novosphingobium TaxID=165696 RepID=UPI000D6E8507|nr:MULTISPECIES: DUF983 domain-containing protein [Novosphingobium]
MPEGESHHQKGQSGIAATALFGLCPRCGARGAWAGPAALALSCKACGLALEEHEPRGRAMYLVVLPVTALLVVAALKLDEWVQLPVWALIALWGLAVPLVITGALRLAKAAVLLARLERKGLL